MELIATKSFFLLQEKKLSKSVWVETLIDDNFLLSFLESITKSKNNLEFFFIFLVLDQLCQVIKLTARPYKKQKAHDGDKRTRWS